MKRINSIKEDYINGIIDRDEYRKEIILKYEILKEFSQILNNSVLEITSEDLILCVNAGRDNEIKLEIVRMIFLVLHRLL